LPLGAILAEITFAHTPRRQELLAAIWKIGPNAAAKDPHCEAVPYTGAANIELAAPDETTLMSANQLVCALKALGLPASPASGAHYPHSRGGHIGCRARLDGIAASGACRVGRFITCGGNTGTSAW
jgi:hypothetical protein